MTGGDPMAKAKNYTEDERVIGAFLNNFRMVDVMKEKPGETKFATEYVIDNVIHTSLKVAAD